MFGWLKNNECGKIVIDEHELSILLRDYARNKYYNIMSQYTYMERHLFPHTEDNILYKHSDKIFRKEVVKEVEQKIIDACGKRDAFVLLYENRVPSKYFDTEYIEWPDKMLEFRKILEKHIRNCVECNTKVNKKYIIDNIPEHLSSIKKEIIDSCILYHAELVKISKSKPKRKKSTT